MKKLSIAYALALFPITGILGAHQLYLENFKKFIVRLFACVTIIGGLLFWIYDLIHLTKQVNEFNAKAENDIDEIIELLDHGHLKEALKRFIKTGHTQYYVQEIIKRGKGDVIVKHFATTEADKGKLAQLIKNGDTESLVIHLTNYYVKNRLLNVKLFMA